MAVTHFFKNADLSVTLKRKPAGTHAISGETSFFKKTKVYFFIYLFKLQNCKDELYPFMLGKKG